ncbi:hypothetical protein BGZ61DRAFT_94103 [Ilyonectria robusta]|uniref:uncharacterized protein n=1 Tax=Ilyonectria robusta TaxID=1079257 RepID=UPI001E8CDFBD|nr:uncharacterized protein BGZ61DRAFT_94103 [Ilyonectria robusta]KAH8736377.1 hypothetical protein BGZ61DRAFT_94103 [Ilyonectria robusta]
MFTCGTCWRVFHAGWQARDQHCDATGHRRPKFECDTCDNYFDDEEDRRNHMDYRNHWFDDAPECRLCNSRFPTAGERNSHEVADHHYCAECQREFQSRNNLQQHMNSARHRSTNIKCPFCSRECGTATGLTHHLERGACPNAPLDRDKLYRVIRERDPSGVISNRALEWHGVKTFEASEKAWNRGCQAYECYLCHRLFDALPSLNAHLSSPRHQQNLYHCPGRSCSKEFTTLAALVNHLESESCGFMRFQAVQTGINNLVSSNRLIGF